jgi:hypothetical protein
LDVATGLATAWDPNANSTVLTIAVDGSTVYAGGIFTIIGGQTRNNIAALDATTGLATAWDANANFDVKSIVVSGSTVYAGGIFDLIGGQTRNRLAALDVTTGLATVWNPNAANTVNSISISGSNIYVGGTFLSMGGQLRNRFAAFTTTITLPVQLISFTANAQNASASNVTVLCNWNTATETSSSHFIIERSSNGRNFIRAGQVAATGNSSTRQSYSFIDNTPLKGISYYRLKLADRDGGFTYSRVAAVTTSSPGTFFTIYPNPSKEEITLAVSLDKKQKGFYSVYDQAGKKLVSNSVPLNDGLNTISLPVSSLPAGIYIIQLKTDSGIKQSQFIKH